MGSARAPAGERAAITTPSPRRAAPPPVPPPSTAAGASGPGGGTGGQSWPGGRTHRKRGGPGGHCPHASPHPSVAPRKARGRPRHPVPCRAVDAGGCAPHTPIWPVAPGSARLRELSWTAPCVLSLLLAAVPPGCARGLSSLRSGKSSAACGVLLARRLVVSIRPQGAVQKMAVCRQHTAEDAPGDGRGMPPGRKASQGRRQQNNAECRTWNTPEGTHPEHNTLATEQDLDGAERRLGRGDRRGRR